MPKCLATCDNQKLIIAVNVLSAWQPVNREEGGVEMGWGGARAL